MLWMFILKKKLNTMHFEWILNKSSCSVLMCKLCPVKQQTDVSVSGKVPGYQPHFVRIVDYLSTNKLDLEQFSKGISDLKPCTKKPNNVSSQSSGSQEQWCVWKNQSPRLASLAELVIESGFALMLLISVLGLQITLTLHSFKTW